MDDFQIIALILLIPDGRDRRSARRNNDNIKPFRFWLVMS